MRERAGDLRLSRTVSRFPFYFTTWWWSMLFRDAASQRRQRPRQVLPS